MLAGEPLTRERAERLSRIYFYAGFALLPWLWAANVALFWRHRAVSDEIKTNVHRSIVGAIVGACVFIAYCITIHYCCPDAPIWVIRPGQSHRQAGFFSDAVYNSEV